MAYSDKTVSPTNINYTSKDFSTIKADLIQYTKAYFPDTYKDFNETSPGMMLIELASYVGDVLSYYIDYNYKESLLTTATERKNVLRLAEFLGYKTTPITPSVVELEVTTDIDAFTDGPANPDYGTLTGTLGQSPLASGIQVASSENSELVYETLGEIDFNISGSPAEGRTMPQIVERNTQTGRATKYRITRYVKAVSGQTKTKSFTITTPVSYTHLTLPTTPYV